MPAKCRSCRFYRRVRVGNWETPDYKTNQGRCIHPMFERCKYAHNLVERKSYYEPDSARNGYKSKKIEQTCRIHPIYPMLKGNNMTGLYIPSIRSADGLCHTQKTHSLTVISQNPGFYPCEHIKEGQL